MTVARWLEPAAIASAPPPRDVGSDAAGGMTNLNPAGGPAIEQPAATGSRQLVPVSSSLRLRLPLCQHDAPRRAARQRSVSVPSAADSARSGRGVLQHAMPQCGSPAATDIPSAAVGVLKRAGASKFRIGA